MGDGWGDDLELYSRSCLQSFSDAIRDAGVYAKPRFSFTHGFSRVSCVKSNGWKPFKRFPFCGTLSITRLKPGVNEIILMPRLFLITLISLVTILPCSGQTTRSSVPSTV